MVAKSNTCKKSKRRIRHVSTPLSKPSRSRMDTNNNEHPFNRLETLVAPSERFARCFNDFTNKNEHNAKNNINIINNLIRKCNLDDDPLKHWLHYMDRIKQGSKYDSRTTDKKVSRPQCDTGKELFSIMKRCTHALLNHPKYTNDPRFIRIIVIYADQIQNSNDKEQMFAYYYKRNIGTQTAIFWISWAFIMEKSFDYKAANRIYTKAMKIDAQPMDVIKKRYRGFRHRVKYYGIDIEEQEENVGIDNYLKTIDYCEKSSCNILWDDNTKDWLEKKEVQQRSQCDSIAIESQQYKNKNKNGGDSRVTSTVSNSPASLPKKHNLQKCKFTIFEDDADNGCSSSLHEQKKQSKTKDCRPSLQNRSVKIHNSHQSLSTSMIPSKSKALTAFGHWKIPIKTDVENCFEEFRAKNNHYKLLTRTSSFSCLSKHNARVVEEQQNGASSDQNEICFEEFRARKKYFQLVVKDDGEQENDLRPNQTEHCKDETTHSISSSSKDKSFQAASSRGKMKSRDYISLHEQDTASALKNLVTRTRRRQKGTNSTDKVVLDHSETAIPRGLKRCCKGDVKIKVGDQDMIIKHKLGSGAYGTVILCSIPQSSQNNIAMKIQEDPSSLAWEYEVLEKIESRVKKKKKKNGERDYSFSCATPFPTALSFMIFRDGATMGMTAGSCTGLNLIDIVNAYKGSVPELLAMYYTSRMLKHLETLHIAANFLHCDIKPDNWVLTTSNECNQNLNNYVGPASDIMLVDFGRAVDILNMKDETLHGSIAARGLECSAMHSGNCWSYDIDTHGICVCAFALLYGSYLELEKDTNSNFWRLKKPFRRYWQKHLWRMLFDLFLNMSSPVEISEYISSLKGVRSRFDQYLNQKKHKSELISMLIRQETILPQKKMQV